MDRQIEVLPGTHLVAGVAGAVVLVAHRDGTPPTANSPAWQSLMALTQLVRQAAAKEQRRTGRALARLATNWLMSLDYEEEVEFGVLSPADSGLAVFLHGGITAVLAGPERVEVLRGRDAGFTVDRVVIPAPGVGAGLFVDEAGQSTEVLPPRGIHALEAGTAPGSGAVVWTGPVPGVPTVPAGPVLVKQLDHPVAPPEPVLPQADPLVGRVVPRADESAGQQSAAPDWLVRRTEPIGRQSDPAAGRQDSGLSAGRSVSRPEAVVPQADPSVTQPEPALPQVDLSVIGSESDSPEAGRQQAMSAQADRSVARPLRPAEQPEATQLDQSVVPPEHVVPQQDQPSSGSGPGGRAVPKPVLGKAATEPDDLPVPGIREAAEQPTMVHTEPDEHTPVAPDGETVLAQPTVAPEAAVHTGSGTVVKGFKCARHHLNDPRVSFCAVCGIRMDQLTCVLTDGVRPPLGLLLLDDGNQFVLDNDIVIGREPEHSEAVSQRGARPVRLEDRSGGMSRAHAEIRLIDWDVTVVDGGSTNGTHIRQPGAQEWTRAIPGHPVKLQPGAQVLLGGRVATFDSQHGQL
ncbi:FHA domain-containing protein [Nocardia arthritidis]|nr:FHA domain-containing protein [Nocardia arthritidis]